MGTLAEVIKEPGVRLPGENMKVYGQFARAVMAERDGDHAHAEELLNKAVQADIAERANQ